MELEVGSRGRLGVEEQCRGRAVADCQSWGHSGVGTGQKGASGGRDRGGRGRMWWGHEWPGGSAVGKGQHGMEWGQGHTDGRAGVGLRFWGQAPPPALRQLAPALGPRKPYSTSDHGMVQAARTYSSQIQWLDPQQVLLMPINMPSAFHQEISKPHE